MSSTLRSFRYQGSSGYLSNVIYPYDYCFAAKASLIPPTSVQLSECSCYIQIRSQDKDAPNFTCSQFPTLIDISVADLTILNPWIGSDWNTGLWSSMSSDGHTQLCVLASTSTAPAPPAETQPRASQDCTTWHVVVKGDGCWVISNTYGITLDQFYGLNPGVGTNCGSLWLGYAVCLGV